jgi:hypothetical protein
MVKFKADLLGVLNLLAAAYAPGGTVNGTVLTASNW